MHTNSSNLTHQILISQINGRTLCIPISEAISLDKLKESIHRIGGVHPEDQRLILNGNALMDSFKYQDAIKQPADFLSIKFALKGGCTGGKGGFGSLLRSAKSVKKTTNYGSCRDLHGRRLRDVQNERRLNEWSEKELKGKEKEVEPVEEKEEKRRKENGGKEWELQTKEITVGVGNSVEKGLAMIREKELKRKREEEKKETNFKLFGLEEDDEDELEEDEENITGTEESDPDSKNQHNEEPLKKKHCPEFTPSSNSSVTSSPTITTPLDPSLLSSTLSFSPKLGPPVGSKRSAESLDIK